MKLKRAWIAIRHNGLSIVFGGFFVVFLFGQGIAGWKVYNQEQQEHRGEQVSFSAYLRTPHFLEATAENWESEFLQMFAYVFLTAYLVQIGSSESKRPDTIELVDLDPRDIPEEEKAKAPWPVKRGGFVLKLYEHSLGLAFLTLFVISFLLHAASGARLHSAEELQHGGNAVTMFEYLTTSQFWFESLQNWQSEFLAVLSMLIFSIFLRERRSPESKPVYAPHFETAD
jgi:hypothetical protein